MTEGRDGAAARLSVGEPGQGLGRDDVVELAEVHPDDVALGLREHVGRARPPHDVLRRPRRASVNRLQGGLVGARDRERELDVPRLEGLRGVPEDRAALVDHVPERERAAEHTRALVDERHVLREVVSHPVFPPRGPHDREARRGVEDPGAPPIPHADHERRRTLELPERHLRGKPHLRAGAREPHEDEPRGDGGDDEPGERLEHHEQVRRVSLREHGAVPHRAHGLHAEVERVREPSHPLDAPHGQVREAEERVERHVDHRDHAEERRPRDREQHVHEVVEGGGVGADDLDAVVVELRDLGAGAPSHGRILARRRATLTRNRRGARGSRSSGHTRRPASAAKRAGALPPFGSRPKTAEAPVRES